MEELNPYLGIVLLTLAGLGFLGTMILLATWLGPNNPTTTKQIPFECGINPVGSVTNQRFNVRFYIVAMLFILFDVEVLFMYPWAVVLKEIGPAAFWLMTSFMVVLGYGFIYVWRSGVLDWND